MTQETPCSPLQRGATPWSWQLVFQSSVHVFPLGHAEGLLHGTAAAWRELDPMSVEALWRALAERPGASAPACGRAAEPWAEVIALLCRAAHRGYAMAARALPLEVLGWMALQQSVRRLEQAQRLRPAPSAVLPAAPSSWWLQGAGAFADDLLASGPFEFLMAQAYVFEGWVEAALEAATRAEPALAAASPVRPAPLGEAVARALQCCGGDQALWLQRVVDTWFWRAHRLVMGLVFATGAHAPEPGRRVLTHWRRVLEHLAAGSPGIPGRPRPARLLAPALREAMARSECDAPGVMGFPCASFPRSW